MKEARDIVAISFPFAAGVALAQLSSVSLFHTSLALVAIMLLLALAGILPGKISYALLFLAIGALCGSAGGFGAAELPLAEKALEKTDALIRSLPFKDEDKRELLRALLTGQREGLPKEMVAAFRAAGASHILALSGLHLGIIYLFLGKVLTILGNGRAMSWVRSAVLIAACCFYALMTGAAPSIMRALLFISLNEILRHCPGRRKSPLAVWCCALMVQLAFSPGVISSLGFQLSYLAMLGIFLLFPAMDGWYPREGRFEGPVRKIWSSMALSISCQIFTAPLVWLRFRTFPKYFLLTNLLALPLTSALMFSAVSCLLLSSLGLSPAWLPHAVEFLASLLIRCLGIIAAIS